MAIDELTVQRGMGDNDVVDVGIEVLIERNNLFPILGKKVSFDYLDSIAIYF